MYYRNANCAVVVYDITQSVSPLFCASVASFMDVFLRLRWRRRGLGYVNCSVKRTHLSLLHCVVTSLTWPPVDK